MKTALFKAPMQRSTVERHPETEFLTQDNPVMANTQLSQSPISSSIPSSSSSSSSSAATSKESDVTPYQRAAIESPTKSSSCESSPQTQQSMCGGSGGGGGVITCDLLHFDQTPSKGTQDLSQIHSSLPSYQIPRSGSTQTQPRRHDGLEQHGLQNPLSPTSQALSRSSKHAQTLTSPPNSLSQPSVPPHLSHPRSPSKSPLSPLSTTSSRAREPSGPPVVSQPHGKPLSPSKTRFIASSAQSPSISTASSTSNSTPPLAIPLTLSSTSSSTTSSSASSISVASKSVASTSSSLSRAAKKPRTQENNHATENVVAAPPLLDSKKPVSTRWPAISSVVKKPTFGTRQATPLVSSVSSNSAFRQTAPSSSSSSVASWWRNTLAFPLRRSAFHSHVNAYFKRKRSED
jgi:hypothetical protein